ncbi:ATP-binding protein [Kitasatospora sp. NPDC101801]|uniref:ATP-binding protein n=1 Tax=Kitasatospora sp. NPDC101801 TaxID=3364103 RepID=UPI00382F7F9C
MSSDPAAPPGPAGPPSVRCFQIDLSAEAHPVSSARRSVRGALTALAVAELVGEDTVLVVCELVANAALHAGGPGLLGLTVLRDGALLVEVGDTSSALPRHRPAGRGRPGGHGLLVVQRLSRRWGSSPAPRGKIVWAEIPNAVPTSAVARMAP